MRVHDIEIDEAALATVRAWVARQAGAFTFGDVADELMRAKVPYAVHYMAVARLLQELRRAGAVAFRGGYWHVVPASSKEDKAA
jgi:hypothetical protein